MKVLIAYYSRTGVTRKAAEAVGRALREGGIAEVAVEEIADKKRRSGVCGWLGAVMDGVRKHAAAIEPLKADAAAFDCVVIGTPVWAGNVSPAARTFCAGAGARAGRVAFLCTMHSSGDEKTFKTMRGLCGRDPVATLAVTERAVKRGDEELFLARVRDFGAEIAAGVGSS